MGLYSPVAETPSSINSDYSSKEDKTLNETQKFHLNSICNKKKECSANRCLEEPTEATEDLEEGQPKRLDKEDLKMNKLAEEFIEVELPDGEVTEHADRKTMEFRQNKEENIERCTYDRGLYSENELAVKYQLDTAHGTLQERKDNSYSTEPRQVTSHSMLQEGRGYCPSKATKLVVNLNTRRYKSIVNTYRELKLQQELQTLDIQEPPLYGRGNLHVLWPRPPAKEYKPKRATKKKLSPLTMRTPIRVRQIAQSRDNFKSRRSYTFNKNSTSDENTPPTTESSDAEPAWPPQPKRDLSHSANLS